jgi:hypoxia up-regulated 1
MRTIPLALLPLLAALCLWVETSRAAAVLAIDYGSEFMKASLMKPGVPFDVLLNKDSKRKIQSSVGFKKGERLFGQDAANLVRHIHTFTTFD